METTASQRRRHRDARRLAQVDAGDLVVASAAGVGVHVLPVRRHHGEHHDGDGDRDLPAEGVRRDPGDREHDEDLVGRVGDRGERVAREDRERDALGQQRLPELAAAQLATQEDPLRDISEAHSVEARARRTAADAHRLVFVPCTS